MMNRDLILNLSLFALLIAVALGAHFGGQGFTVTLATKAAILGLAALTPPLTPVLAVAHHYGLTPPDLSLGLRVAEDWFTLDLDRLLGGRPRGSLPTTDAGHGTGG